MQKKTTNKSANIGDIVVIKWQDPAKHDNLNAYAIGKVKMVHTTTTGQLLNIDADTITICSELVWNFYSDDSIVHAFPRRVVEDMIVLIRKDQYLKKLGKLVTIEQEDDIRM